MAPKKTWVASGRIRTLGNSSDADLSEDAMRGMVKTKPSRTILQDSTIKLPAIY